MSIRIATLAATALAIAAPSAFAEQNISKRATVSADVSVDVSNVSGRVDVTAWDKNEVELTAFLESDKDKLEFEATAAEVRIKVSRPSGHYRGSDDANLTLKVPKGARLDVNTVSADVEVAGVRGEQSLRTVSGGVETQAFDAPVSLATVSGDGTVAGTGGKAEVSVQSVSGSLVARGVRGEFEGEIVSGDLTADVTAAENLSANTVSGDIKVTASLAPAARVDMESISGTLDLSLKAPVNAEFDVESFSGGIESCFKAQPRDTSKHGPGSELRFTEGNGGARIEIETLSGDIRVCGR